MYAQWTPNEWKLHVTIGLAITDHSWFWLVNYTFWRLLSECIQIHMCSIYATTNRAGLCHIVPNSYRNQVCNYWCRLQPPPKPTPKQGACGAGQFTCLSDPGECIPNDKWCNRKLDCKDSSDERNCPGDYIGMPKSNFWSCHQGKHLLFTTMTSYGTRGRTANHWYRMAKQTTQRMALFFQKFRFLIVINTNRHIFIAQYQEKRLRLHPTAIIEQEQLSLRGSHPAEQQ